MLQVAGNHDATKAGETRFEHKHISCRVAEYEDDSMNEENYFWTYLAVLHKGVALRSVYGHSFRLYPLEEEALLNLKSRAMLLLCEKRRISLSSHLPTSSFFIFAGWG